MWVYVVGIMRNLRIISRVNHLNVVQSHIDPNTGKNRMKAWQLQSIAVEMLGDAYDAPLCDAEQQVFRCLLRCIRQDKRQLDAECTQRDRCLKSATPRR